MFNRKLMICMPFLVCLVMLFTLAAPTHAQRSSKKKPQTQSTVSPQQYKRLLENVRRLEEKYSQLKSEYTKLAQKAAKLEAELEKFSRKGESKVEPKYSIREKIRTLTQDDLQALAKDQRLSSYELMRDIKNAADDPAILDKLAANYCAVEVTIKSNSKKTQRLSLEVGTTYKRPRSSGTVDRGTVTDTTTINTDYIEPRKTYTQTVFFKHTVSETKKGFLAVISEKAFAKPE